ncbi:MAG: hypothetical protein RLZZ241_1437 [Bacteroidota bacterium]
MLDLLVIGGGAAGFYGAIHVASRLPKAKVLILDQNREFLSKVKISGGGRCNLTHRPMAPELLAAHYPRGERELLGPFYQHASKDTMSFFEQLGVALKIESDGRVFPQNDNSQTIIDALIGRAKALGIRLQSQTKVIGFGPDSGGSGSWSITTGDQEYHAKSVLVCPGSSAGIWKQLEALGHSIVPPVPSLFTFRISDARLSGLQGISTRAHVWVAALEPDSEVLPLAQGKKQKKPVLSEVGPLLITHWGLSGPAVLRLSAWGARELAQADYRFILGINWLPDWSKEQFKSRLLEIRKRESAKFVVNNPDLNLPIRLWRELVAASGITPQVRWADLTKAQLDTLQAQLSNATFHVIGKSTFKEEFVTAGGVALKEVNFKTFESKKLPGLFFAGEVLNIDAITGGFNFQNAWTGAYLASNGIVERNRNQDSPR